jgi:hypothetical protein
LKSPDGNAARKIVEEKSVSSNCFPCSISFRTTAHTMWTIKLLPSLKSRRNVVEVILAFTCLCLSSDADAARKNVKLKKKNVSSLNSFPVQHPPPDPPSRKAIQWQHRVHHRA